MTNFNQGWLGLPKSNEINPVHSRKDAFLSSKALSTAGYSLLIFKWYVCGFDTDIHESRPYASSGTSNKSDDGDKLANTTSTVCSLPLPHAFDVNKLDVESYVPPSGVGCVCMAVGQASCRNCALRRLSVVSQA
jgi:hypothetical protein